MVLIQALIALLRKSLGNVFRAIFGWATMALFGAVSEKDRNLLTAVVAAAAIWPVMLLGVLLPRTGAFLLAFVPIPKSVPTELVRGVWIGLTALVPVAVGWFLRRRTASDPSKRTGLREWLMGFPVTLGLAAAFTFACVAVPIRKLIAMARGLKEAHIPLVIPPEHYKRVAADLRAALDEGNLPVAPTTPPWTTRALSGMMRALGGSTLATYLPKDLEYLKGSGIELTIYPNGVRVSGPEHAAARAHALIAESATRTEALQAMTPTAQEIEKRIKTLLAEHERGAQVGPRVRSLAVTLADTDLSYEEWETLYRELLQLTIAVRGGGELLQRSAAKEAAPTRRDRPSRRVGRVTRQARDYARRKLVSSAGKRTTKTVQSLAEKLFSLLASPTRPPKADPRQ